MNPSRVTRRRTRSRPWDPLRWMCLVLLAFASRAADSTPRGGVEGFEIARPGRTFEFPRDHGSHPEFSIEWWYITGHLQSDAPKPIGFQVTFFRRSTRPPGLSANASGEVPFGLSQIYLAHMALSDPNQGIFLHQERLGRDGWDAWAKTNQLDVRNGNWSLRAIPGETNEVFRLQGSLGATTLLDLTLTPMKPRVFFGTNGVSRKAVEPSAASHYITYPRLGAVGTWTTGSTVRPVKGEAWFDHEFSSSQLGEGQIGWDWASIQLNDGREVMAYRMRRQDGSTDPFSTLAWIDAVGRVQHFDARTFRWEVLSTWKSPKNGATYPARIRIHALDPATGSPWSATLVPRLADQELEGEIGGISYWEGACAVEDAMGKEIGKAYLELTGYAATLKGRF